jgi:RNA polymerase sigma factor (sigma-70 family)
MSEVNAVSTTVTDDPTDAVLLERYTSRREDAAFAALVRRYSPLVLSVCRRVLQHEQDAEDALQAVFCVLARKAASIRRRGAVGAWLHGVAYRIARKARARRGRQPVSQSNLPDIPAAEDSPEWAWKELRPILDAEVNHLPTKCRQVFVLCYLEGLTNEQAAAQLGCPLGTVLSGLARARELLRARLTRRGLTLSAAMLAAALGRHAAATPVRAGLAEAAVQMGLRYAAGQAVGAGVATLADGFLKALLRARLTITFGLVSALAVVVAVVCLLWYRSRGAGAGNPPAPAARAVATPQAEREKLQGSWQVVGMERAGQQVPAQANQGFQGYGFRFTGSRWTMSVPGGPPMAPMPFVLDPSQEPKAIDLTMFPGKTIPGIYQVDEDSLTLCVDFDPAGTGGKRPTTFRTQPDALDVTRFVLRREPVRPGGP